jgi:spore coat protein U-like protein
VTIAWSFAAHNQKLIFLYSTKTDKIMKKFLLLTAIASAASVAAVAPAIANEAPAGGVITVNAITTKFCTTPSNITIPLGEYNGTVAVGPTAANVTFKCTNGTAATVAFSSASTSSGNSGNLLGGNPALPATPIAYTYSTSGTSGTGNGLNSAAAALTSTANISIAAGQAPTVGSYTDTINVTVSY